MFPWESDYKEINIMLLINFSTEVVFFFFAFGTSGNNRVFSRLGAILKITRMEPIKYFMMVFLYLSLYLMN